MSIELPMPLCPGPDCRQPEDVQAEVPPVGGVADTEPNDPGELEPPPEPETPAEGRAPGEEETPQAPV